jgi:chromosome segregation ATPase
VGADPRTSLASEIARLDASIDRAAAVTETTLTGHPPASEDDGPHSLGTEQKELARQLAALRERVALAKQRSEDPHGLHAELATLLSFARMLQADAEKWRSALQDRTEELERDRIAARREQQRLAAEREELVLRRDALQSTILQTAAEMAQQNRGEWRRTVPVITLAQGVTVCSVSVFRPSRWFRFGASWLVTLSRSYDVLVRRE